MRYILGLTKNDRIKAQAAEWIDLAESLYDLTGKKQRLFASVHYGALRWDKPRRVIVKAEHTRLTTASLYSPTPATEKIGLLTGYSCNIGVRAT